MNKLQDDPPIVVLITCGTAEEAQQISSALVRRRFIACGNVISQIQSIFRWDDRVTSEAEALLIGKSKRSRFNEIITAVQELHSYQNPEILALPVVSGAEEYIRWVVDETSPETE